MKVEITSVEGNASFEIIMPKDKGMLPGATWDDDATKWNGVLPETGDYVVAEWPKSTSKQEHEPWRSFVEAREQLDAGERTASIQSLRKILNMPNLESRHYLQAWHFLRELGENPTGEEAKRLHGIVVEVGLKNGLDMVAAYVDGTARYFNYAGAAIIWERPDNSLDSTVEALLTLGQGVINQIGPWEEQKTSRTASG